MTDREKVIKGLECCVLFKGFECTNRNCPYWKDCSAASTSNELLHDVLAMLKAQEPCIVTEADFENADEAGFIPAWFEEKDTGEVYCECISIGALEDAKFGHVRWWTSRPDEKVRVETPWED